MPPKAVKKTEVHKQEITDKIREIKLRQQSWLKHDAEKATGERTKSSSSNIKQDDSTRKNCSSNDRSPSDVSSQKCGFGAWIERRAQNDERSYSRCDTDSTALDLSSTSDDNNEDVEEIEAVADKIVTRVRQEVRRTSGGAEPVSRLPSQLTRGMGSLATAVKNELYAEKSHKKHPNSHYCSVCQQLMLPPTYAPILMVPCGDTVCSTCARWSDQCPLCRSVVRSRTCNLMLQQIVEQYGHEESIPPSSHSLYNSKKHTERKNNIEEHNNLQLRCEILEGEQGFIKRTIEQLDRDKQSEQMQIQGIEKQQRKLDDEIEELRERQRILESHKAGYIENCNDIEERKKDEKRKLSLLQTTIGDLRSELMQTKLSSAHSMKS